MAVKKLSEIASGSTFVAATDNVVTVRSGTTDVLTTLAAVAASGSASDLTTGTLPAAQLPNPSASTLGGVESIAAVSHNFLTSISTSGVPSQAQPAFTDISGTTTTAQISANVLIMTIGVSLDGGGSALSTGQKGYVTCPYAGTIVGWNITADAGTCTLDVWKIATGTAIPTVSNTIINTGAGGVKPALATGTAIHSTTVSNWTTSVVANDIFGFNLDAVATATKITLVLQINKT